MEIPFYALVLVWIVGILLFGILSMLDVYHLIRFDAFTTHAKVYIVLYILAFFGLVGLSIAFVGHVDWFDSFTFSFNASNTF